MSLALITCRFTSNEFSPLKMPRQPNFFPFLRVLAASFWLSHLPSSGLLPSQQVCISVRDMGCEWISSSIELSHDVNVACCPVIGVLEFSTVMRTSTSAVACYVCFCPPNNDHVLSRRLDESSNPSEIV